MAAAIAERGSTTEAGNEAKNASESMNVIKTVTMRGSVSVNVNVEAGHLCFLYPHHCFPHLLLIPT